MGLNTPLVRLLILAVAVEVILTCGAVIHAWLRAPHGKPPHYAKTWLGWHMVPPWRAWRWLVVYLIRRGHTQAQRAVERHDRRRAAAPPLAPLATSSGAGWGRLRLAGSSAGALVPSGLAFMAGVGVRVRGWVPSPGLPSAWRAWRPLGGRLGRLLRRGRPYGGGEG